MAFLDDSDGPSEIEEDTGTCGGPCLPLSDNYDETLDDHVPTEQPLSSAGPLGEPPARSAVG